MSDAKPAKKPRGRGTAARKSTRSARAAGGGKTLVIVESGAKAETIAGFLGDGYDVQACFGHIRDLPRRAAERPAALKGPGRPHWAEFSVNVDEGFEPVYIVPKESKEHVTKLKRALKSADRVLLATDEDREGESIGWHLLEVLQPKVPCERIVFHEITRDAIERALQEPRAIDAALVDAQESRRILDRLYGYSLSPLLWRKLGQGMSAGRVQSVALRFLVERERERMAFRAAEYWGVDAEFAVAAGSAPAKLTSLGGRALASGTADFDPATGELAATAKRWLKREDVEALTPALEAADWRVASVEKRQARRRPQPPFTTSTMQQTASNRLGFAARRTMAAAQSLYQGKDIGAERVGLITYMRTDSVTLAEQALGQAGDYIRGRWGADHHDRRQYTSKSRNAQEAHEAIRPTDFSRTPDSLRAVLDDDEWRLYDLIWRRAVASQMSPAQIEQTTAVFEAALPDSGSDSPAQMTATGQIVVFDGWYAVLPPGGSGEQALLPAIVEGERAAISDVEAAGHESQPPARYTEASLVRKLEEDGLGRPSTYASVLETLTRQRGYAFKRGQTLIPSFLGMAVADLLTAHFGDLVNAEFTAEMEDQLDQIAQGNLDRVAHLGEFYFGAAGNDGLKSRIAAKQGDSIPFWVLKVSDDGLRLAEPDEAEDGGAEIRVRTGRAYLRRGAGDEARTAPLPDDLAPADLTAGMAGELLERATQLPRDLGRHPEYDERVFLLNGRFGPFVQVGETPKSRKAPKPRRASVPSGIELDDVTLEHAIDWLQWPKTLGLHPDSGEEVTVRPGRWGAYVQMGDERRNLKAEDDLDTIDLERALALLKEPKAQRGGRGRANARRSSGRRRRS